MSNDIVPWEEALKKESREIARVERPNINTIGLRSGILSVGGNPVPGNKLDCIILLSAFENIYYTKPYDPDSPANPECFSIALATDTKPEMVPHPDVINKQNPTCAGCPKQQWGTATRNGKPSKGKACGEKRRLLLIPVPEKPEDAATSEVALLKLPVTSVKEWQKYVNNIASMYERPPWGLITEITTKPDPKTQFQVLFNPKGLVTDEVLGVVYPRLAKLQDIILQPYGQDVEGEEEPPPAEVGKKRKY